MQTHAHTHTHTHAPATEWTVVVVVVVTVVVTSGIPHVGASHTTGHGEVGVLEIAHAHAK
jgi:hypothetical protein